MAEQTFIDYDEDESCHTCQGDGFEECGDTISCFEAKCTGRSHRCPNCRGSGSARDEWYW